MTDQPDAAGGGDDVEGRGTTRPSSPAPLVTAANFRAVDFEAPVRTLDHTDQHALRSAFDAAARQAKASNNEASLRVYQLLEAVMGIFLRPEHTGDVWVPHISSGTSRTALPSDFRGEQSAVFLELLDGINHPALRARLADIVWTNDRRVGRAAVVAATAYRDCSQGLLSGRFKSRFGDEKRGVKEAVFHVQRMMQIIHATTKKGKRPGWLKTAIEAAYRQAFREQEFFPFVKLAKLGLRYELLEPRQVVREAEALASAAPNEAYPMAVKEAWLLAVQLNDQMGDTEGAQRARLGAVQCTLAMRKQVQGSAAAEAFWVLDALQELRHIQGMEATKQELEEELRRLQKASLSEMGSIPIEFDIGESRDAIVKQFDEIPLAQGLLRFALLTRSRTPEDLRAEALQTIETAPLLAMMPVRHIDADGRTVNNSPGASLNGEPDPAWFDLTIDRAESLRRVYIVESAIDPARQVLHARFGVEERHLAPIFQYCPFVPDGHAPLLTLGFTRFFQGDLVSAAHLVVPQVEPMIRHALKINGHDPSKRRDNATEEDLSLGGLFSRFGRELQTILGEALCEEIDRLFNRRPGPALRHEFAHGQVSAGGCFHPSVYYAIWLVFHVCCLTLRRGWNAAVTPAIEAAM